MSGDQYRYCYRNIPDDMGACTGFPFFVCSNVVVKIPQIKKIS